MPWNPITSKTPPVDYEYSIRPTLLIPIDDPEPDRLRLHLVSIDDTALDPIEEMNQMLRDNRDPALAGLGWDDEMIQHVQDKIDNYEPNVYTYPEWSWEGWTDQIAEYLREKVFGEDMIFGTAPSEGPYDGSYLRTSVENRYGDLATIMERMTSEDEFSEREPWRDVIEAILDSAQQDIDGEADDWPNRPVLEAYWPMLVDVRPLPIINNYRKGGGRITMGSDPSLAESNNVLIKEHFYQTGRFPSDLYIDIGIHMEPGSSRSPR
jgi:hypothetical protein